MRDCTNPAMKDLLPELLHERGADLAAIRAHVAECASCARELALLRDVRALAATPRLDNARIAAAVAGHRSATPWRRMYGSPLLRAAAVILVVVGGATLLTEAPRTIIMDTSMVSVATHETARGERTAPVPATGTATELAVGDALSDLSESDLRALLSEMGDIEAITPTETDIIVLPAVGRSGG